MATIPAKPSEPWWDGVSLPAPRVVAVLETMWDWRSMTSGAGYREAPRYFRINPNNYSGKRLYKLIGPARLLVTNACRDLASHANGHGKPDTGWLRENLEILDRHQSIAVILVCGKVAQACYRECGFEPARATVFEIPHPAARGPWTKATILENADRIQRAYRYHDRREAHVVSKTD